MDATEHPCEWRGQHANVWRGERRPTRQGATCAAKVRARAHPSGRGAGQGPRALGHRPRARAAPAGAGRPRPSRPQPGPAGRRRACQHPQTSQRSGWPRPAAGTWQRTHRP
eukprot:15432390-Alexandrium_andersonii.AAC.1